ncbi:EAL domain-containing protein [Radiobacillus kanasensis]|uniref:EAL domain-containing protein n=1 Tax=Radiobacillus kanasensis TaxID=2844358 RepID=UPI001E54FB48|nr:EAL domain-containing protein [Radiobacillus kanasensis]UFU00155.1 EAL domain-containing protein [Radiobacillus kanasensis]
MPLRKLLTEKTYYHHFQPIFCLESGKRIGHEALIRADEFESPEAIFLNARDEKRLYEVDSGSIHKAIQTYVEVGFARKEEYLFLNVFPSTILHSNFQTFLDEIMKENGLDSQLVIFEISETEYVENLEKLSDKIADIKELGFKFAVDDVGKGYSNLPSIIELKPDYIKLDQYFSKNIQSSLEKQKMVSYFITYCKELNIQLVLEGLETTSEVDTAITLGIPLGQGFVLGKPKRAKEVV